MRGGAQVAALIAERGWEDLDGPIVRVRIWAIYRSRSARWRLPLWRAGVRLGFRSP